MDFNSLLNNLAGGQQSGQPVNYDDWNQMVGSAPPEQFGRAAYGAIRNADPEEYRQHVVPGYGNTDPLGSLPQTQRSSLAQSLLGELTRRGMDTGQVARNSGVTTLDPRQMSPNDLAGLLSWTQQNEPKAFGRVASQYQDQPNILQALLGNPALMSMLTSLGAQLLSGFGQRGQAPQMPEQQMPRNIPDNSV
jgi:hypothetical protein